MVVYKLEIIKKSLLAFISFIAFISLSAQQPTEYEPLSKSLRGLKDFYYTESAFKEYDRHPTNGKVSHNSASKTLKNASSAMGFTFSDKVHDLLNFYTSDNIREYTTVMLALEQNYMPLFEKIIAKEEVPQELKYFPMAVSALNTRATSSWGATGLWQLMFTTGKLYNLKIDSYVDERRDPEKSTIAAIAYLKDLYTVYLDWELTIAAYTSGPASVNKAIRKAGGSRSYNDIYPFLPAETRDYVPAFVACYIIANNPEAANLKPMEIEVPNFMQKEPVEKRLHLGQVAELLKIPLKELQDMNPEYKSNIIPYSTKTLWIKLPISKIGEFNSLGDSIYTYNDTVFFPTSRRINIVTPPPAQQAENGEIASNDNQTEGEDSEQNNNNAPETQSTTQSYSNKTKIDYTVKEGDNLGFISSKFNVSISDIKSWNGLNNDIIKIGQILNIYVPTNKAAHYQNIAAGSSPQQTNKTTTTQQTKTAGTGSVQAIHTVKQGETISSIATKYPKVTADDIMKFNKITNPRSLQIGQKLKIPKK